MEQLLTRLSVATAATAATGGGARGAVTAGAAGSLLLLLPPPPAGNTGGMASTLIRFLSLLDSGSEDDRRTQFRIDPDCVLCLDGAD